MAVITALEPSNKAKHHTTMSLIRPAARIESLTTLCVSPGHSDFVACSVCLTQYTDGCVQMHTGNGLLASAQILEFSNSSPTDEVFISTMKESVTMGTVLI